MTAADVIGTAQTIVDAIRAQGFDPDAQPVNWFAVARAVLADQVEEPG